MQTQANNIWWLRIATFSLAALAAASVAYWVLKWVAADPANQSGEVVFSSPAPIDPLAVARLLGGGQTGAAQAAPPENVLNRFTLTGVVADRVRGGYALIAIDGKPARPFRVGAQVSDTLVLQSVAARGAALAASLDAPVLFTLELPKLVQP